MHLRIFDGDLYDSCGYDLFRSIPSDVGVTSVHMGSEPMRERSLSPLSNRSNSSTAPSIFSSVASLTSPGTSVRPKDGIIYEDRKEPSGQIFLFTCLRRSAEVSVWEAGLEFPGSTEMVPVVAKLEFSAWPMQLIHERNVYDQLTHNPPVQLPIPTCYGLYCFMENMRVIGLLLTSLVPGIPMDSLADAELEAAMCVYVILCSAHSTHRSQSQRPSIRDAVKKIHAQGVTHGDIAGRNIIVHDGKATLIDFGNASITTDANSHQEDVDAVDKLLLDVYCKPSVWTSYVSDLSVTQELNASLCSANCNLREEACISATTSIFP